MKDQTTSGVFVKTRPKLHIHNCPYHLAGQEPDEEQIEQIEDDENKEEGNRKGKQLGLPEIDPDALPSSMVSKYLNLDCMYCMLCPTLCCASQDCDGQAHEEDRRDPSEICIC